MHDNAILYRSHLSRARRWSHATGMHDTCFMNLSTLCSVTQPLSINDKSHTEWVSLSTYPATSMLSDYHNLKPIILLLLLVLLHTGLCLSSEQTMFVQKLNADGNPELVLVDLNGESVQFFCFPKYERDKGMKNVRHEIVSCLGKNNDIEFQLIILRAMLLVARHLIHQELESCLLP